LVRERAVASITIDRPEARNALNLEAMADLDAALAEAAGWDVHAVLIRGAGDRAFVSGGDLKELESVRDEEFALGMARRMRATLDRIPALPMPVVAIVNGHAIGGGAEVAIACDYRIAADDVKIGFTQATLGLMPAWGGIERLVQAIGRGRALQVGITLGALDLAVGLLELLLEVAHRSDRVLLALPLGVHAGRGLTLLGQSPLKLLAAGRSAGVLILPE